MQQVTFSDQAMHELNKLDLYAQLQAIHPISSLKASELAHPREPLGHFRRGPKTLYRLRVGEFRFYFEMRGTTSMWTTSSIKTRWRTFFYVTSYRFQNSS